MSSVAGNDRRIPLIAHIIFRLDVGGLENGLVNLINELPAARYRHAIVCLKEAKNFAKRIENPSVSVFELNKKDGKDPACYWRMWRMLRQLKPEIVHTRNANTLEYQFVAAVARIACRIHGEHGWDVHDLYGTDAKYRLLRRMLAPFVHRYITVSRNLRSYLIDSVGIDADRVVWVCNGVDTQRFAPSTERDTKNHSRAGQRLVIGTVGRLHKVKNQILLVRAFACVVNKKPDLRNKLRLLIVGDGPCAEEIKAEVATADIEQLVCLAGATDDVPAMMNKIDVFVLPSINEGMSNTILEAMASGLPVIGTRVGGTPEIVEDGKTGVLVELNDVEEMANAILMYVDAPALRQSHGAAARARVEADFSLKEMVRRYGQIYGDLLSGSPRLNFGDA